MVNNSLRLLPGLLILISVIVFYFSDLDYLFINLILILVLYDLKYSKFISFTQSTLIFILLNIFFVFENFNLNELINLIFFSLMIFLSLIFKKKIFFIFSIILFLITSYNLLRLDRDFFFIIILISFLNDTSAFLFGRYIGGPKILPNISPNKTWSGTTISFFITFSSLYLLEFNFYFSIFLSLSFFIGDIYFSYFKRQHNINDFSYLFSGHGGILDRLDSIFLSTFLIYYFLFFS